MATNQNNPAPAAFSEVFAGRLREVRERQGMSQAEVAAKMDDAGFPINRATLAKIEAGGTRRDNLTVDEAMALCSVLGLAPVYALTPTGLTPEIRVTDKVTLDPIEARYWIMGTQALSESTARSYYSEVADSVYAARQRTGVHHLVNEVQAFIDAAGEDDREAMADSIDAINSELDRQRDALNRLKRQAAAGTTPRKG